MASSIPILTTIFPRKLEEYYYVYIIEESIDVLYETIEKFYPNY